MDVTKEQAAVDSMMKFIHETALPFNGPETGVIRWTFESFVNSPNGQKLYAVLLSLTDPRPTWEKPEVF